MQLPARDIMQPLPYRVLGRSRETRDTLTLSLEPAGVEQTGTFAPGQFNMLYAFGQGEVPISVSGDPGSPQMLTHTIRAVGPVTNALCALRRGEVLGVRGPFGTPWPVREAQGRDVLLIAGGLGLAPLRPALYHVLSHREEYGNAVLLYGARTPQDLLYSRELHAWRSRFDLQVEVTVDAAMGEWKGNVGVVPALLKRARFTPSQTLVMLCGPEIMMRFTVIELLQSFRMGMESIYLSMERNMKCGIGLCGHCQLGPFFVCKDGPIFRCDVVKEWAGKREV